MLTITTKFYGPTNSRGARIRATDGKRRVFVSYEYGLSTEKAHEKAFLEFVRKFLKIEPNFRYVVGGNDEGYCFTFIGNEDWNIRSLSDDRFRA